MNMTVPILQKKYPVLLYFDLTQQISNQALDSLAPEAHLPLHSMTPPSKLIMKTIKSYVNTCEQKLKKGRKLYYLMGKLGGYEN